MHDDDRTWCSETKVSFKVSFIYLYFLFMLNIFDKLFFINSSEQYKLLEEQHMLVENLKQDLHLCKV